MRAAGGQGPGGARGGIRRRGPRGTAGHLPPPRHADGRAGQLRGGRHQSRARRDVRGPPSRAGKRWPGAAVDRWRRLHPGRAPVADRRRDLLPRLARRQGRRGRHRHAAVVGVRLGDQAGLALPRVDHEPAQVRPHRPPGRPQHAGPDRDRGPVGDGPLPSRGSRPGYPAAHQAGPVPAGRADRHREPRRAPRRRGPAGLAAGTRRAQGRRGVQHPRWRGGRRRRVRRRGPAGRPPGLAIPSGRCGTCFPAGPRWPGRSTPPC